MDSHHRKELETNELRDWVNRTVHNLKTRPQRIGAVLGVIALVVACLVAAKYIIGLGGVTQSALWSRLDSATDPKELDAIINEAKGETPGTIARFYKARLLLTDKGIDQLNAATPEQRQSAAASVEEARKILQELIEPTAKDEGLKFFHREALLHAAMAEEALCGVPKGGNPADTRGSLARSLELYQQLVRESPDSLQGRKAAYRVKELSGTEEKRKQADTFYAQLAAQFANKVSLMTPQAGAASSPAAPPFLTPATQPPSPPVFPPATTSPMPVRPPLTAPTVAPPTTAAARPTGPTVTSAPKR